jgi:hypothetical protein
MRSFVKIGVGMAASAALLASSTVAVAAAPASAPASYQAPNAWVMLSALSPSVATAGSAAAAAQPADVPPPPPPGPPPPPPEAAGAMSGGLGEMLPIALWFGIIAIGFAVGDNGGSTLAIGSPNSPA